MNHFETPWGNIVELKPGKKKSLAFVALNPNASKPIEWHSKTRETFELVAGSARIILMGRDVLLRNAGSRYTLEPDTMYQLMNIGSGYLQLYSILTPGFDPQNVHVLEGIK